MDTSSTSAGCWCITAQLPPQQTQTTILGILRDQDIDGVVIVVLSGYRRSDRKADDVVGVQSH